jgi:hypothetical protein
MVPGVTVIVSVSGRVPPEECETLIHGTLALAENARLLFPAATLKVCGAGKVEEPWT